MPISATKERKLHLLWPAYEKNRQNVVFPGYAGSGSFMVSKLGYESVPELRSLIAGNVMKDGEQEIKEAKAKGKVLNLKCLAMEITLRQFVGQKPVLLYKGPQVAAKPKVRAKLLFNQFPDIKSVYYTHYGLGKIFSDLQIKDVASCKTGLG